MRFENALFVAAAIGRSSATRAFFVKCADILFEGEVVLFQSSAIVKKPVLLSFGKAAFLDSPILMLTSEPDLMPLRRRPVKSTAPHLLQP